MFVDIGILLVRVLFGVAIASHGSQKLFGWFGGHGLKGTGGFFETIGFTRFHARRAVRRDDRPQRICRRLLLTVGLLTPLGAAMLLGTMIVAMVSVHLKNGFFAASNGIEIPFLYAAAALGLVFTRAGAYSLDNVLDATFFSAPYIVGTLLVLTIVSTGVILGLRTHDQPQTAPAQRVK